MARPGPAPSTMPRAKSEFTEQLTLNVTPETCERSDALAERMTVPGVRKLTRSDVLRAAIEEGLKALDARFPAHPVARKR